MITPPIFGGAHRSTSSATPRDTPKTDRSAFRDRLVQAQVAQGTASLGRGLAETRAHVDPVTRPHPLDEGAKFFRSEALRNQDSQAYSDARNVLDTKE